MFMIEQYALVDIDNQYIGASPDKDIVASIKLIIHAQKHDVMLIVISLYYLICLIVLKHKAVNNTI